MKTLPDPTPAQRERRGRLTRLQAWSGSRPRRDGGLPAAGGTSPGIFLPTSAGLATGSDGRFFMVRPPESYSAARGVPVESPFQTHVYTGLFARDRMTGTTKKPDPAAKQRMIDSAIELFAAQSVDNVPVRQLTSHAGVNVAAVNYYFGGKDALAETVFGELSARINKRRLTALQTILEEAAGRKRKPRMADIVAVFIDPYVGEGADTEGMLLAQLILKHRLSPSPMTQRIIAKHFDPMAKMFVSAFHAASPEIPMKEMFWRYTFMVSGVVLSLSDRGKGNRLKRISGGEADASNLEEMRSSLLRFLVGGMGASAEKPES